MRLLVPLRLLVHSAALILAVGGSNGCHPGLGNPAEEGEQLGIEGVVARPVLDGLDDRGDAVRPRDELLRPGCDPGRGAGAS